MPHLSRIALLSVVGLFSAANVSAVERAAFLNAVNSITGSELRAHVDVLADDSFEGREAGQRGGRAAAGYLRDRLQSSGLRGAGDDGGFDQVFGNGYRNVLGLLEGSDPDLKNEVILVGAHYDHVGYGSRANSLGPWGYVHNGADDNASGTAGLLETMDAIVRLSERPKRSILFAFWDGEEKGLLGSKHWAATPTIPLSRVVFAINVDMIGRLRDQSLKIYGARSGWGLRRLLASQNNDDALRLEFDWAMKSNSDH
jgi:acetylornithine deacetylase/succinyl-diaminopimelate desuccinylase-like protein